MLWLFSGENVGRKPFHPIGWEEACKNRYGQKEWSSSQRTEDSAEAAKKKKKASLEGRNTPLTSRYTVWP